MFPNLIQLQKPQDILNQQFNMDLGQLERVEANPTRITKKDLVPQVPEIDGTAIILQRHEEYIRDKEDTKAGSLTEEAVQRTKNEAKSITERLLQQLSPDQRNTLDVMVVASDTQYYKGGKRSIETAEKVIEGVQDLFSGQGINQNHLLNNTPLPTSELGEPKIFLNSPEFVKFMEEKYGTSKEFWIAYETEAEKETRLKLGAEGPIEMADRLANFLASLARHAKAYHNANPGRRLMIWVVSHYDTISPFVKKYVAKMSQNENLTVDYGAGIAIDIKKSGEASTLIEGKSYQFSFSRPKN